LNSRSPRFVDSFRKTLPQRRIAAETGTRLRSETVANLTDLFKNPSPFGAPSRVYFRLGPAPPGRDRAESEKVNDPSADNVSPPPENDEGVPALPLPTNRIFRPSRAIVATITLTIVFGIVALLVAIGISRLQQIEPTPVVQKEASPSLSQSDSSPVEHVDPPKPLDSLMLDATRSYLASNAQAPTDIERLQLCLTIEDGYKERLDCYDGVVAPDPKSKPPIANLATDCRFLKEQDERLACFNRFVAPPKPPKVGPKATPKTHPPK
jgi:hypothetical protein